MPQFRRVERERLNTCHPSIIRVVTRALELFCPASGGRLFVVDGWRGERKQNACYADGTSGVQWPDSPHNKIASHTLPGDGAALIPYSLAVDLCESDQAGSVLVWDTEWDYLAIRMFQAARECDVELHPWPIVFVRHGRETKDLPHFQLADSNG